MARFIGRCCAGGMGFIGADEQTAQVGAVMKAQQEQARQAALMRQKAAQQQALKVAQERAAAAQAKMTLVAPQATYRGSCDKSFYGINFNGKCVKIDGPLSVVEREVEGPAKATGGWATVLPTNLNLHLTAFEAQQRSVEGLGTSPAVNPDGTIVPGSGGPAPVPPTAPTKVKRWFVQHNGQDITRGFTSKQAAENAMKRIKEAGERFASHLEKMEKTKSELTGKRGSLAKDKQFKLPPGIERQSMKAIGRFRVSRVVVPGTSQVRVVVEATEDNINSADEANGVKAVKAMLERLKAAKPAKEAGPAEEETSAEQKTVEGLGSLGLVAPSGPDVVAVFTSEGDAERYAMARSTGISDAAVTEAAEAAAATVNGGTQVTVAQVVSALEEGAGGRQLTAAQRSVIQRAIAGAAPKPTTPTEVVTEPDANGDKVVVETEEKKGSIMPLLLVGGGIAAFALMK